MSEQIQQAMATVPGCVEIVPSVEAGNPEVKVEIDRQRMADYGLTMAQVGLTLQTAFSGNADVRFRDGTYEYPIRIALDAFDRRSAEDIRNITFVTPLGNTVFLKQFAEVRKAPRLPASNAATACLPCSFPRRYSVDPSVPLPAKSKPMWKNSARRPVHTFSLAATCAGRNKASAAWVLPSGPRWYWCT